MNKNDIEKNKLAIENNIKEQNYIVIDCRYSDLHWIKNSILNSRLNELFDLSDIDWLKCEDFALSNRVKEVCNYWSEGETIDNIIRITSLSKQTIYKYLKSGNSLEWCSFDSKKEGINKVVEKLSKKVLCLETGQVFESIKKASIELKMSENSIGDVCRGKKKQVKGYSFKFI